MKAAALLLAAALLPAQTPVRRALAPAAANGWARVVVDDDAADGLWVGDAEGHSVPFLWESDATWSALPLQTVHPVFGKDAKGHPTGAFTLRAPEGFTRGDREQVKLELALEAPATPWMCRVDIARRGDGGAFIALDDGSRFLYDLGPDRHAASITLPWDADDYRVTLVPVQGGAPKLTGVSASACTLPSALKEDARVELAFHPAVKGDGFNGLDHASLGGLRRLIGLEVLLQPPAAPVRISAASLHPDRDGAVHEPVDLGAAELWNLPALNTRQTRLAAAGEAEWVHLDLPEGAVLQSATALIRHRRLFFPAEAGQAYFLHSGGLAKRAPGSLGELPASSRAFYGGAPLALGPPEADPQAVAVAKDPVAPLRRFLPWAVGLLILLLASWGFRLLKAPQD